MNGARPKTPAVRAAPSERRARMKQIMLAP